MNHKISVFIITLNEEKIIEKCLEKLNIFDEIIIVDSGSTDKTIEICNKYNAKVFQNKFVNFSKQKQFALNLTKNDWVLSLDADEVLTDELLDEIKSIKILENYEAYFIPRTHVFLNKIFNYGSENKKLILRLFNKNFGNFDKNIVHEEIVVIGKSSKLKNEFLHYTAIDFQIAINKQIKYALLSAENLNNKRKKSYLLKIILKFPFDFINYYIVQRNFLNGYQGFTWSMFSAFCNYLKYTYLKELNRSE